MPYQVIWARCNVFAQDGTSTTLERGDFLPEDLDETQVAQLATFGATVFVDFTLAPVSANPAARGTAPIEGVEEPDESAPVADMVTGPTVVVDESGPAAPAHNASKAEWVDYAVSKGMSREDAEKSSRSDLVEKLG